MFYQPKYLFRELKKMFAGYIKVLGGLYVARGPDVAQAVSVPICKSNNDGL